MRKHIDLFLELGKVRIASLATITMMAGYVLAAGGVAWELLPLTVGVFFIACGSAAINHIQDRDIDGRMQRTRGRPLPSGRITIRYALITVIAALTVGTTMIWASGGPVAAVLGLIAVFWYNVVYTPLKRVTAFAAVPGGVVGAIPPIIGWVAAGGNPFDARILAVAFFFFVWQVPHFWLLLLFTAGRDSEKAGLPSLTRLFDHDQLARITFMWIIATAMTCLLIPLFGIIATPWINLGFFAAGLWLVWKSSRILRAPGGSRERMVGFPRDTSTMVFRTAFKHINLYVCWVIALLAADAMIR